MNRDASLLHKQVIRLTILIGIPIMPTIEIVSLGATELVLDQKEFELAIIEEKEIVSHRGLFADYLEDKKGVIVHIGNPEFRFAKDEYFFAGMIVDWDFNPGSIESYCAEDDEDCSHHDLRFKFLIDYQIEIDRIISFGFEKSPQNELLFLTDYQFGPIKPEYKEMNYKEFWCQHDNEGLEWNVLYKLTC